MVGATGPRSTKKATGLSLGGLLKWSGWLDDFRTFWLDAEEEVEAVKVRSVLGC